MNPPPSESPLIGTWLSIGSPVIAELAGACGFDWVLIDLEHGCASEAALPSQIRALRGSSTRCIVRVPAHRPDLIGRALDWGAHGIMIPHVDTAEQAEAAVRAAYYPPRGTRGYSRSVRAWNYGLRTADPEAFSPLILPQIESAQAVANAPGIARVQGVTALFVGPADLQFDLRNGGAKLPDEYQQSLVSVVAASRDAGKAAGILAREPSDFATFSSLGFAYIAVDSDLSILRNAYTRMLSAKG